MDNEELNNPIKPYINEDGYYPQCARCWTELEPGEAICHICNQVQDWSWSRVLYNNKEGKFYENKLESQIQ